MTWYNIFHSFSICMLMISSAFLFVFAILGRDLDDNGYPLLSPNYISGTKVNTLHYVNCTKNLMKYYYPSFWWRNWDSKMLYKSVKIIWQIDMVVITIFQSLNPRLSELEACDHNHWIITPSTKILQCNTGPPLKCCAV